MKKIFCFLLSFTLLLGMVVAPAPVNAAATTATPVSGNCTCGCGAALKDIKWQPWDPNTKGSPVNGHYYLESDYTHNTQYQVNSGVRMVLDLRGHKLTTKENRLFLVYGYLAIIDTVGGGRISSNATGTANGGAILIAWDAVAMNDEMDATVELYDLTATLEAGKSGLNGGVVGVGGKATLRTYNCTFLNASAKERGGAIYNSAAGTISLNDTRIIGCHSVTGGGAIFVTGGSTVTLTNCKLTANETDGLGGNIYANQGSLAIENSVIESGVSLSTAEGGGNIHAKTGCTVTIKNSTVRNGYCKGSGGNLAFAAGTQTITNSTVTGGVAGKKGANIYCFSADAKTTLNNAAVSGDMHCSAGTLTLKGATKIGLNATGLKLAAGTVTKASGLSTGAEIYVDAEGTFTDAGANAAYFKGAYRTGISTESTGLKATQGSTGYCPHCKASVTWTAIGSAPSGHCYLTADLSRSAAYSITADTVIDLRGFDITSTDRAFTVTSTGSLALLDSVGGSTVTGSGNADKLGGIIQSAGPLRIYGGNYTYVANSAKPLTSGGILYTTGALYIHGGSYDASAFNNTTDGKGGALFQAHNAGNFTMSAGYFRGGKAFTTGTMFIGGKTNTVTITGGHITGGSAAKNIGNLYITGEAGTAGKATISGLSITDGTAGTGDAGNFSLCYYGKSTMTDCFIARGTSTGNRGGNAYFTTNTNLTLTDCVMLAGTATRGGNFYTTSTATNVTLTNCLISDGIATSTDGGNICCGNGTITIRGGVIAYGTAATAGGNISNVTGNATTSGGYEDDKLYLYADANGNAPLLTGGSAGTLGGNLYTKGQLILDAAVFNCGKATTKGQDLYFDKATASHMTVGAGVTGTVSIAIAADYIGGDTIGGPVTNTSATTLNARFVLEVESAPLLCVDNGKLCVGAITVKQADGTEIWYADGSTAVAECPADGWVKLYTNATLEMSKDCIVDLNGNTATVTGDHTLYGMDSSGNDYSLATGKAQWASADKVNTQTILEAPNGNYYVAVIDGASVSYHCIGLRLTHVTIRPENCGIYYRGAWGCDNVLANNIAEYGIAVSLKDMPGKDFETDPDDCLFAGYDGAGLVSGEVKAGVIIENILQTALSDKENANRGEMPIYATAYIKLKDGTVLIGDREGFEDDVSYSLRGAMETMDHLIQTQPANYLRPVVQAARDFYAQWKDLGMEGWRFNRLKQPEDDGVLKIIILGSSRSVNTFQLLYQAFKDQLPDQEFVMGVMYYSGCSMTMHEKFIKTNQPVYQYYRNDGDRWVITPGKYMYEGLIAENWDVVLLQAGTGDLNKQMQLETRKFLKSYVDDYVVDPYELWWHSTWFNSTDPVLYKPPKTEADAAKVDQIAQLTETNEAAKQYVLNDPMFAGHVTSGTPMMYALKVLDVPEINLYRDHTHLSDFGCLLVAYSFYAQYTGNPVTKINLDTIPVYLRHKDYQSLGDMTVTDDMKQIIIDTVAYTMNNLWSVPTGE